ncbi:MAG TPA: hypothetical protein DCF33_10955 [Saprospirales bacterium]|nr:hypothetical protein [Saprospirales bacterium]
MIKAIICFVSILSFIQPPPVHVKGSGYSGYIFDENYPIWFSIKDQKGRFTPSKDEIMIAEKLLKKQIKELNKRRENQIGRCPVIDRNLCKYKRQYVGFLNTKNEKILWINFIWHKKAGNQISKEVISVYDGCSNYWGIKINLNTGEVYDLFINGLA